MIGCWYNLFILNFEILVFQNRSKEVGKMHSLSATTMGALLLLLMVSLGMKLYISIYVVPFYHAFLEV